MPWHWCACPAKKRNRPGRCIESASSSSTCARCWKRRGAVFWSITGWSRFKGGGKSAPFGPPHSSGAGRRAAHRSRTVERGDRAEARVVAADGGEPGREHLRQARRQVAAGGLCPARFGQREEDG